MLQNVCNKKSVNVEQWQTLR